MEVVPLLVGNASRSWDEQALDAAAAAGQVGSAPTGGFTAGVSGAASRFTIAWHRHASSLAEEAEAHADGLRVVLADYLATDRAAATNLLMLSSHLQELR